jgi:hypothetical protein
MVKRSMHGKISSNFKLYTRPNHCIITKNTTSVNKRLKSSPMVSDSGKKKAGISRDFNRPDELTMLPTDWPVTLEKKNQSTNPEVTNRT